LDDLKDLLFVHEHSQTLVNWLKAANVTHITPTTVGDLVQIKITAAKASALFQTTMYSYQKKSRRTGLLMSVIRAVEYSVPHAISKAVSIVGDLIHFPSEHQHTPTKTITTDLKNQTDKVGYWPGGGEWKNSCPNAPLIHGQEPCKMLVTPAVLKERYNIPEPKSDKAAAKNSMAVASFAGQYYDKGDVESFAHACDLKVPSITDIGTNMETKGMTEAMLDIEYMGAIGYPVPLQVWYQYSFSFLSWLQKIASTHDAALVHSVSYGDDEVMHPTEYMNQVNVQLQVMVVRGIYIVTLTQTLTLIGGYGGSWHLDPHRFRGYRSLGSLRCRILKS